MLPHVILHIGMSADGRLDWGAGDEGLYHELAARFKAEAMLTGSRTMLAAYASPDPPQADDEAPASRELYPLHVPLLVVVDSRGQVRTWSQIKKEPYWRNAIAVCRARPGFFGRRHLTQADPCRSSERRRRLAAIRASQVNAER